MTDRERQGDSTDDSVSLSRRQALGAVGVAEFAGLSTAFAGTTAGASSHRSEVNVIENPNFISDAHGNGPPFDYNTLLFDPGPETIPLDELVAADDTFGNELFRGLSDSRRLVTKPPEDYDREAGYDET